MYDPKNVIRTTLSAEFVHGTDNHAHLTSATGFPAAGGYGRVSGVGVDEEWALYEWTGVSTNDLIGLTPCTLGEVESTAAHTFPAGSRVELIPAAEYMQDLHDKMVRAMADMVAKGPGYWTDGLNDVMTVADNADLDFGTGDGTIFRSFSLPSIDGASTYELYARFEDNDNRIRLSYRSAIPDLEFYIRVATNVLHLFHAPVTLTAGVEYTLAVVIGNGVAQYCYLNGIALTLTDEVTTGGDLSIAADLDIGEYNTAFSQTEERVLYQFNLALTATEVLALANSAPVPYKYLGASQTELAAGNLTLGKAYRITARDDAVFTDDGAADNNVGTEFVATATTVTLDAGDKVIHIGCPIQLEQAGIGHNQWIDASTNEHHATNSGALPTNLGAQHEETYVDLTLTGNSSFTLPMGYKITSIIVKETAGNALTGGLDVGFAVDAVEIVSGMAVGANATVNCTLVETGTIGATHTTADDAIHFSDGNDDTNWDGAELEARVQMRRTVML